MFASLATLEDVTPLGENGVESPDAQLDASVHAGTEPVNAAGLAEGSLKQRAIRGSGWTIGGYGLAQLLRFANNVALTHLLFPEAFGLMMLVNVCLQGLQMFSDVGIGPALITSNRGDDEDFLDTAWTIQAGRGVLLWLVSCALAMPAAWWFGNDMLTQLLPVAGIAALLAGFNSTDLFTLNRHLKLRGIVMLEAGTQVAAIIVSCLLAWWWESVWALVFGGLAAAAVKMLASHLLVPEHRNRFRWDPTAAKEQFAFGRWIFVSTVITFAAANVDRLLLGRWVQDAAVLGIYAIAWGLAQVGIELVKKLNQMVGFPALADLHRRDVERFKLRLGHLRLVVMLTLNPCVVAGAWLAPLLIHLVYPDKFSDAGWILTSLAVSIIAEMATNTYFVAYFAAGSTFRVMLGVAIQFLVTVVCVTVGYTYGGFPGYVLAMAFVQWLMYPVHAVLAGTLGIWQPKIDLPVLALSGAGGFAALWFWWPVN